MRQADFGFEPDEKYSTSCALDVMGSPCAFGGADKPYSRFQTRKILTGEAPRPVPANPLKTRPRTVVAGVSRHRRGSPEMPPRPPKQPSRRAKCEAPARRA